MKDISRWRPNRYSPHTSDHTLLLLYAFTDSITSIRNTSFVIILLVSTLAWAVSSSFWMLEGIGDFLKSAPVRLQRLHLYKYLTILIPIWLLFCPSIIVLGLFGKFHPLTIPFSLLASAISVVLRSWNVALVGISTLPQESVQMGICDNSILCAELISLLSLPLALYFLLSGQLVFAGFSVVVEFLVLILAFGRYQKLVKQQ